MIYLIDLGTCYKIGMTNNLKNRVKQFKTSREFVNPIDVIVYPYSVLDIEDIDNKMETDLHQLCQDYKISGELFQKTPEIIHIFKRYKFDIGDNHDWTDQIKTLLSNSPKIKKEDKRKYNGKEKTKRIIYQYDLEGNFIKKYNDTKSLKKEGFNEKGVLRVLRGEQYKSQGYIWNDTELSNEELNKKIKLAKKRAGSDNKKYNILQYNLDGNLLAEYETITIASKRTGIAISSISLCCNGKYKTAGNYIWKKEVI